MSLIASSTCNTLPSHLSARVYRQVHRAWHWPVLLALACYVPGITFGAEQSTADEKQFEQQILELIEQLGDQRYTTRERAQAKLSTLGLQAFEAISEAQSHNDVEISLRAKYLLRSMHIAWTQDHDPVAVKTILKGYEQLGSDQRVMQMHALAQLENEQGTEALCRLARFERTDELSKEAAVLVLSKYPLDELGGKQALLKTIQTTIGPSQRSATLWLRVYAQWFQAPSDAVHQWGQLVRTEEQTLSQAPDRSSPQFIRFLLRQEAEMLRLVNRVEDANTVVFRLIQHLDASNEIQLLETADWMAEQHQWKLILEFADRQQDAFEKYPLLAYRLAEAWEKLGDLQRSEDRAKSALDRALDNDAKSHRQVAQELRSRGLLGWAEQEYRRVIDLSPATSFLAINASYVLSEMLHDTQQELEASRVLQAMIASIQQNEDQDAVAELLPALRTFRSRERYFASLHHANRGERDVQRKALEEAIKHDPFDADVLIAMYRLPGQDLIWQEKTVDRIDQATVHFRRNIQKTPDEASHYNQLAWLVANTFGDYDEALECSHKSLELGPGQAGYLDTLARCYFAKGDLDHAIRYQKQAVKLEPFTMQIQRQLDFFQSHLPSVPNTNDPN